MADIVILGAGVMGSAMTLPGAERGHTIDLVGTHLDEEIIRSVSGNGLHPRLGVTLPETVTARHWTEFGATVAPPPKLLILGVSSAGVGWAIDRIVESVKAPLPVVMITKGLMPRDGTIEVLPRFVAREVERRTGIVLPVMAVGGPCIAGELAARRDTSIVVTGPDRAATETALGLLDAPFYHARVSTDVVGVEICAAFKNFYALAVGAAAGLLEREGKAQNGALMHNLAASLFTQSLEEMTVLVEALGGEAATVRGLAGSGDLYVTCQAGRNSRMGRLLGLGLTYTRAKADHMATDTIEGAQLALDLGPTLEAMLERGALPAARMPLTRAIVAAVTRDAPLDPDFALFHHG
jgi:glycerol-3-phosphate dehydrogenase (NAD(P)+)